MPCLNFNFCSEMARMAGTAVVATAAVVATVAAAVTAAGAITAVAVTAVSEVLIGAFSGSTQGTAL